MEWRSTSKVVWAPGGVDQAGVGYPGKTRISGEIPGGYESERKYRSLERSRAGMDRARISGDPGRVWIGHGSLQIPGWYESSEGADPATLTAKETRNESKIRNGKSEERR